MEKNYTLPKWLRNPLYSKGKKRKFTEEAETPAGDKVPATGDKPPAEGDKPTAGGDNPTAGGDKPAAGPTTDAQVSQPKLSIVEYGSSDEEEEEEEITEEIWIESIEESEDDFMFECLIVDGQPPPPGL